MVSMRKPLALKTAADFTTRTKMGTISIAVGGVLNAVEVQPIDFVLTSTQTAGGLVELENDAVDWIPFQLLTPRMVALTSTSTGGANMKAHRYKCHKRLPKSTVTVYYTAIDAGNQSLGLTLFWETTLTFNGRQTYFKCDLGTEITQVTVDAAHNTIAIPELKGGRDQNDMVVQAFFWVVHGTLETIVESGGKLKLDNDSAPYAQVEFMIGGATCIGAGAVEIPVTWQPISVPAPGSSNITSNYTPHDNQSQAVHLGVMWTGI